MLAPVLASSLTTVAAFMPLMLVGGIVGKILFDIPLVVICVIIASVIESFLVCPATCTTRFAEAKARGPARSGVGSTTRSSASATVPSGGW